MVVLEITILLSYLMDEMYDDNDPWHASQLQKISRKLKNIQQQQQKEKQL